MNNVTTDKVHCASRDRHHERFDINTKSALGAFQSGMGWSQMDKFFAMMNVPTFNFATYKRHEDEVGMVAEEVAKQSCKDAVELERQMTMERAAVLQKSLPEAFRSGFIIPGQPRISENASYSQIPLVSSDDVVRITGSYDMGWSTRGTGHSYNSLNGFGALMGNLSGQVLHYSTCNRKCKKCDLNGNCIDHDCRRNFYGSAKAMEPYVGKKLVVESEVRKGCNVEVGVLIGDDDSSTIAACRNASDHDIIKQSDMNHAGGVKKKLYQIARGYKELNTEGINHLHRCFTYALTQNQRNSPAIAAAIRSIPHHAFNDYTTCGTWCGYLKDKDNYEHSTVPDGFSDIRLYQELKVVFYKLADTAEKFSLGASSNRNESLNATMASKAPKSRCYSMSASLTIGLHVRLDKKSWERPTPRKLPRKYSCRLENIM